MATMDRTQTTPASTGAAHGNTSRCSHLTHTPTLTDPSVPVAATPELIAALELASRVLKDAGKLNQKIELDILSLQLAMARLKAARAAA